MASIGASASSPTKGSPSSSTSSGKEIELANMNDDCLISLFRKLSMTDLNAIALNCHRFHNLVVSTVYQYHPRFKQFNVSSMATRIKEEKNQNDFNYSVECVKEYLQRFGHLIEDLNFDNHDFLSMQSTNEVFAFIAKFCVNGLKSLNIRCVNLEADTLSSGHLMFKKLTKLEMDSRFNWHEILPMCLKLEELKLRWIFALYDIPFDLSFDIPKLKTLTICVEKYADFKYILEKSERAECFKIVGHTDPKLIENAQLALDATLDLLLKCCLNITSVSLSVPTYFVVGLIGQLENLEELHLEVYEESSHKSMNNDLQPFYNLSRLKRIEIKQFHPLIFSQFLRQSASAETVEDLTVQRCTIDSAFMDGLGRFNNLRRLSISSNFESTQGELNLPQAIWQRLQRLSGLIELHFDCFDLMNGLSRIETSACKVYKKFLQHLAGAQNSLRTLSLQSCGMGSIDDEFFTLVAQFEQLHQLKLQMILDIYATFNWQPLRRLTQLKELVLDVSFASETGGRIFFANCTKEMQSLLSSFISFDTLVKLEIRVSTTDSETIKLIGKFVNLKELTLCDVDNLSLNDLNIFGQLKQMEKFEVHVSPKERERLRSNFSSKWIVDLVKKWQSLELFKLRIDWYDFFYTDKKIDKKYSGLHSELAEIFKGRNKLGHTDIRIENYQIQILSSN